MGESAGPRRAGATCSSTRRAPSARGWRSCTRRSTSPRSRPAPRRRLARAQRHRARVAALRGRARVRPVRRQPHHRRVHPHRRDARNDTVGGRDDRRWTLIRRVARTSSGSEGDRPRAALGRARPPRRDRLDDRPAGLGQVDDRRRRRGARCSARAAPPTCSTGTTSATGSTATSASRPRTAPRTCAAPPRSSALLADAGVVVLVALVSPYRADRDGRPGASTTRRGLPFLEVHVATSPRGVRAARPEGPLRPRPRRRAARA